MDLEPPSKCGASGRRRWLQNLGGPGPTWRTFWRVYLDWSCHVEAVYRIEQNGLFPEEAEVFQRVQDVSFSLQTSVGAAAALQRAKN